MKLEKSPGNLGLNGLAKTYLNKLSLLASVNFLLLQVG